MDDKKFKKPQKELNKISAFSSIFLILGFILGVYFYKNNILMISIFAGIGGGLAFPVGILLNKKKRLDIFLSIESYFDRLFAFLSLLFVIAAYYKEVKKKAL